MSLPMLRRSVAEMPRAVSAFRKAWASLSPVARSDRSLTSFSRMRLT